jgi:glc operon protein GlcG
MSCGWRWVVRVALQRQFGDMAMRTKPSLSFQVAQVVADACLEAARRHDVTVSIAVVDEAGGLLHFGRMDGARAYTIELAAQKARVAASIGVPTSVLEDLHKAAPGQVGAPAAGRGGVPVLHEGVCAGAVGVSGAKPDIDDMIAAQGVEAVRSGNVGETI